MAGKKQQPDRDEVTPPVAGTNPPTGQAASGAPAPKAEDRAAPGSIPSAGDLVEDLFAEPPVQEDLFGMETPPSPAELASGLNSNAWAALWQKHTEPRFGRIGNTLGRVWRAGELSPVQKILVASILLLAAAILYVLLARAPASRPADRTTSAETPAAEPAAPPRIRTNSPAALSTPAEAVEANLGEPPREGPTPGVRVLPGPEPLSLQLADKLYLRRDFEPALSMYDKLYGRLPATDENQPLRDFLLLRMALCCKNSGRVAQADSMLRTASLSRLPILRALARYHQSTTLLGRKRYLEAATKAYQTIALIEVANYDKKWVSAIQQECSFLAAEAMTRSLLSLCDADANLPKELWSEHPDIDPLVNMGEPQLRAFLATGVEQLEAAVLSPQIRRTEDKSAVPRWSVICSGAPIEELLARFAANAGVNIRWTGSGQTPPTEDNVRARPVYLYLTAATTPQVVTTAAGSVGLIAQTDDKGGLRLLDPTSYSSLADHTSLLAEEAITLWQRFLLAAENDARATNAHFATALLQAARGQFDRAIAEYKLVANRPAQHALIPQALLQSGMLKVRLRDYVGAHADLKQLVELYPETELADRAGLYLADATMKAGLYAEAAGLYRKVYNLGLSATSQAQAALGAGRCLYETGQYEEAAKWLSQYASLAPDRSRPGFSAACLLLGKAYLALHQPQQAQAALNLAIKGDLSHQQHVETTAVLARTYVEQGLYLEALNTLESTNGWQLSQQQGTELALLRAEALRSIGLTNKAVVLLEDKARYLPNPELQAKVALELARCHGETGDFELARKALGQAFATVEPGPLADQIGRELVVVCLRLGQTAQAVSVCTQLLERTSPSERPAILALLTDAYRRQGKYDQAVAVMLDRYQTPESTKDN